MLQLRTERTIHTNTNKFTEMVVNGKKRAKSKLIKEIVLGLNIPLRSSLAQQTRV
jgi:hypothetical protein